MARDPYEVLGVPRHATPEEIKAAFRKLAAQHHPDRNPGDEGAQQRFKDINAAYQLLSDGNRRAMFDRFGGNAPSGPFGGGGGAMPFDFSNLGGLPVDGLFGDLLEKLGFKQPDRGDLRKEVFVTLEEACRGCEKELTYDRLEVCGSCVGTGARPGSNPKTCVVCGGRGRTRVQQGILPIVVERECTRCNGRGRIIEDACTMCRGAGLVSKTKTIVVTVPPGVEDGQARLVDRAGNVSRPDRAPGDLEIVIRTKPHPFFRRHGDDVTCTVPISFMQACVGGAVEVPTLDGKGNLRVPPGTQPGSVLRLKGKGMPKRVVGGRGDQLMEVRIEVPTELTPRAKELVEELAKELGENVSPQQKTFVEKLKELFG